MYIFKVDNEMYIIGRSDKDEKKEKSGDDGKPQLCDGYKIPKVANGKKGFYFLEDF